MRIKEYKEHLVEKIKEMLFLIFTRWIYCSLNDYNFTMDMYIRLTVDNDHNALKRIKIAIPKFILASVADDIAREYIKLSKNDKVITEMRRRDTISSLYQRHELFRACAIALDNTMLTSDNRKRVMDILDQNGIRGENIVKVLMAEIKMLRVKIKGLQANEPVVEEKENKKADRSDFSRIFARLTEAGYIANKDMSVLDYIEALWVHSENMKRQQAEIDKLKNKR